jgi:hypothetical protein
MSTGPDDDALAAALIQIAAHAERISHLDNRETAHHQDAASQIGDLARRADTTATRIDAITKILGHHATTVNALDGLDRQVTAIARHLEDLAATSPSASDGEYQPIGPPRWWHLTDAERETAITRLRAWIEQVYQPGYGHLAATLPACWEHHPLCLYTLDWLSELWSALYLQPQRTAGTLAAQAEWQTRLLPAAASQMTTEGVHCRHGDVSRAGAYPRPPRQP